MKNPVLLSTLSLMLIVLVHPSKTFADDSKGVGMHDRSGGTKVKTFDFSGDDIDGELVKPDGEFVDPRSFASHTNLIRIRKDFISEILKSAEDL